MKNLRVWPANGQQSVSYMGAVFVAHPDGDLEVHSANGDVATVAIWARGMWQRVEFEVQDA